jgi:hypothetical protein
MKGSRGDGYRGQLVGAENPSLADAWRMVENVAQNARAVEECRPDRNHRRA